MYPESRGGDGAIPKLEAAVKKSGETIMDAMTRGSGSATLSSRNRALIRDLLNALGLNETRVTDAGVVELKAALPELEVWR
ncbi:MAG: hypothetical protein ACYS9X_26765 [Planctomycetota bacterium]